MKMLSTPATTIATQLASVHPAASGREAGAQRELGTAIPREAHAGLRGDGGFKGSELQGNPPPDFQAAARRAAAHLPYFRGQAGTYRYRLAVEFYLRSSPEGVLLPTAR